MHAIICKLNTRKKCIGSVFSALQSVLFWQTYDVWYGKITGQEEMNPWPGEENHTINFNHILWHKSNLKAASLIGYML